MILMTILTMMTIVKVHWGFLYFNSSARHVAPVLLCCWSVALGTSLQFRIFTLLFFLSFFLFVFLYFFHFLHFCISACLYCVFIYIPQNTAVKCEQGMAWEHFCNKCFRIFSSSVFVLPPVLLCCWSVALGMQSLVK